MNSDTQTVTLRRPMGPAARPSHLSLYVCSVLLMFGFVAGSAWARSAYVDAQVRTDLRQHGTARVIIRMAGETQLSAQTAGARRAALRVTAQHIMAAAPSLRVRRQYKLFPLLAGTVDAAALDRLAASPDVAAVFPDRMLHATLKQSGPLVGQPQAEAAGITGKGVGIAVIDTGVDYTHPALGGSYTTTFTDLFPGQWAWQQVQAVSEHHVVTGYPDGSYQPGAVVTRDQMAVFIARGVAGGDAKVPTGPATASFPDVPTTSWAFKYVEYCKAKNIVTGLPDGSYGPSLPVTRGQMAVFIARAVAGGDANVPDPSATPSFTDVTSTDSDAWAYKYVEYAKAQGIVSGYPDGTYKPDANVTRDQMAVFVARGFHLTWDGKVVGGFNALASDPAYAGIYTDATNPMDDEGHGTNVAGIAASSDTVYRGIAPGAHLLALKVLDSKGSGPDSDVIAAIEWCLQNENAYNIRVMNLSMGGDQIYGDYVQGTSATDDPLSVAITQATNAGIAVVAAAGNGDANGIGYTDGLSLPAAAADAISVGATKDGGADYPAYDQPVDGIAGYSNRGELLDLYAPGSVITAPGLKDTFPSGEGTSFASPHIAGAAADLYQAGLHDPRAIKARLMSTGVQIVDPDTGVATPRLNLVTALNPPTNGPDLIVTGVTATVTSYIVGDSFAGTLTVKNQGNQAAPACQAIVVLSQNAVASAQDAVVATVSVPALAAGAQQTISVSGKVPATDSGTYYLGAYVDSGYTVTETDESNNGFTVAPAAITVANPSAQVTSATIPATLAAGHTGSVSITLMNDGTVTWTPTDYALHVVSADGSSPWGLTQVPLPAAVAPGSSTTFNFTITAPANAGAYPCFWQMARDGTEFFGEVATGATKTLALDDATGGEAYPSVSGDTVAFMDFQDTNRVTTLVKNLQSGTQLTLPDSINLGANPPADFALFKDPYTSHFFPSVSGNWVSWVVDDVLMPDPSDSSNTIGAYQVVAWNLAKPSQLPIRLTYQKADAWMPCVDGHYVVWEDYRNDTDKVIDPSNPLNDNSDIYIADLNDFDPTTNTIPVYPLCTAPGPQFSPRISGNLVVWEDWRDGQHGQIYMYDLSVDSDGNGIPNWKEKNRPSPDPAETQLTSDPWDHEYPAISGRNVVWMDMRDSGQVGAPVDIYSLNVDTRQETALATDPLTYRQQPRIDGNDVVWEDWRSGVPQVYWSDLTSGLTLPLTGSEDEATVPDISGPRVAYAQYRTTVSDPLDPTTTYDVYNIWSQKLLPYVTVTP